MTIRDDLASAISCAVWADIGGGDPPVIPSSEDYAAADAALAWLGGLDPDADPELIVWHLRNSRPKFTEGDRVRTVAETTGPAGTVPAGAEGVVSEPFALTVTFDGDDLGFLFGDGYRPLAAIERAESSPPLPKGKP